MPRSLPRTVFLLALVTPGLTWSCGSTRPIRRVVNEDGETVRVEAAEEAAPAVDQQTLTPGPQPPPAVGTTVAGYDPFVDRGCPPEGTAKSLKNQKQNQLKNRISTPQTGDIDKEVTFAKLREPGDDTHRWSSGLAATIEGYCRSAQGTQGETCNCGKTAARLVDTHFETQK